MRFLTIGLMTILVMWLGVAGGCKKNDMTARTQHEGRKVASLESPDSTKSGTPSSSTKPTTMPVDAQCKALCAKMLQCLKLKESACLKECQSEKKRNREKWEAELKRLEPMLQKPCAEFLKESAK